MVNSSCTFSSFTRLSSTSLSFTSWVSVSMIPQPYCRVLKNAETMREQEAVQNPVWSQGKKIKVVDVFVIVYSRWDERLRFDLDAERSWSNWFFLFTKQTYLTQNTHALAWEFLKVRILTSIPQLSRENMQRQKDLNISSHKPTKHRSKKEQSHTTHQELPYNTPRRPST